MQKKWEAALKTSDAKFHDVDAFIYAASEYEDRPEDCEFFKRAIRKEARRWVVIEGGSTNLARLHQLGVPRLGR